MRYRKQIQAMLCAFFIGTTIFSGNQINAASLGNFPHVDSSTFVRDIYNESFVNNGEVYNFSIPVILLEGKDIEQINNDINKKYVAIASNVPNEIAANYGEVSSTGISYECFLYSGILTLIIKDNGPSWMDGMTLETYVIDIQNSVSATKEIILNKAEIYDLDTYKEKVAVAAGNCFCNRYENAISNLGIEQTLSYFQATIAEDNIEAANPYLTDAGELYVEMDIASLAGPSSYPTQLSVENYTASPYYEQFMQALASAASPEDETEVNDVSVVPEEETITNDTPVVPEEEITTNDTPTAPAEEVPTDDTSVAQPQSEYIFEDASSRNLDRNEVMALSLQAICYAKNEIYAKHGRRFVSIELQEYFGSKSWYNGTIDPSQFSESVFNSYEKYNVDLLAACEKSINSNGYALDRPGYDIYAVGTGNNYTVGSSTENTAGNATGNVAGDAASRRRNFMASQKANSYFYMLDVDMNGTKELFVSEDSIKTDVYTETAGGSFRLLGTLVYNGFGNSRKVYYNESLKAVKQMALSYRTGGSSATLFTVTDSELKYLYGIYQNQDGYQFNEEPVSEAAFMDACNAYFADDKLKIFDMYENTESNRNLYLN